MTRGLVHPLGDPVRSAGAALRVAGRAERGAFDVELDLTFRGGEVTAVLGPNGAGKSTLLRVVAGLHALAAGRLTLGDAVLDDVAAGLFVPPERRPVGLVFQDYRLFPHLTVRDNVAFARRARGLDRRAARSHAEQWLGRLGIVELAGRKPGQLSGGQAQRVALARALAADPGVLLLDEPLAALDVQTRLDVRGELRRHLRAFAGPSLLVTHDPLEAMVLADRLVVVESGRVVQEGAPGEVARRPATPYVARLVGLNLYRGRLVGPATVELDGGHRLVAAEFGLHPASTPGGPASGARPVLAAVRPTAISLHTTRPEHSSPRNLWEARVAGLELLSDRVRVQLAGGLPALVDVTPAALAELDLAEGSRVWASVKATEIDVYADPSG